MKMSLPARGLFACLVLMAGASPRTSSAEITPEAQAVVDRYLGAVGGRAAWAGEASMRVKGSLSAFGLSGSVEQWTERPDRSATVTVIGPFTLREGMDKDRAWRVDQNGKRAMLDGKDLEDARSSTWFGNEQWLALDQGGGRVSLAGREQDSLGAYQVLEIVPPVGRSRQVWFSERTGLIDRELTRRDNRTVTSRQSDYRLAAGRTRPHRTQIEVEGMPLNTATLVIDSVWVGVPIEPAVFAAPRSEVADWRFLRGKGPAKLSFTYSLRHVWVRASVNGLPPADFLLDTGASVTVIDSAYAAAHGIKAEGKLQAAGAGAAGGAALGRIDSLRVVGPDGDGVALAGQNVAVLSLSPYLAPFFFREVSGVLGYDFISRFVLEVDFDRSLLVLHDPGTFVYAGAGKSVPLTLAGNIPVVKARIDDQYEGEFRLDIGSGSTVDLHGPFVARHGLQQKAAVRHQVQGGGFGGSFATTVTRMKKMEIGPFSWTEPMILFSGATSGGLASEDFAGNIGNHILERFKVTFDYERRVVHLEPGARFGQRDYFTSAGVRLGKIDGRVLALEVLPGSPAAQAGIKVVDQIVAVDGKPVESYTIDQLSEMFEHGPEGRKHTFEVLRLKSGGDSVAVGNGSKLPAEGWKKKKFKIALREML